MGDNHVRKTVVVVNPAGIHARPADMFVKLATTFQSEIEISKNGQAVDGKSILGILTLGAAEGTELEIGAKGDDAEEAVAKLTALIEGGFAENNCEPTSDNVR